MVNKIQLQEDLPMLLDFQDFIWTISNHYYLKQDRIDVSYISCYRILFYLSGKLIFNFIYQPVVLLCLAPKRKPFVTA